MTSYFPRLVTAALISAAVASLWTADLALAQTTDVVLPAVEIDTGKRAAIRASEGFSLKLDRALDGSDGRLAVFLDNTDITDLLARETNSFRYRAEDLPLSVGEHRLRIFLVNGRSWIELADTSITVANDLGYVASTFEPAINLEANGEIDRTTEPEDPFNESRSDVVAEGRFGLLATWQRPGWSFGIETEVVAVSEESRALRFFERGDDAPLADLASYRAHAQYGQESQGRGGLVEIGHTTFGSSRYLVDSFQSRGVRAIHRFNSRVDAEVTVLSGTSLVGWSNPLGLSRSEHQLRAGRLGFELLPRLGALRLDLTVLDGERVPDQNFNGSSVTDTEKNQGASLALAGGSANGRVRYAGSYARSRFENPEDPSLAQGADLVAVVEEDRDARHGSLEIDLVQGHAVGERVIDATVRLAHERVEPLFRTVGVDVLSDVERNTANLNLRFGGWSLDVQRSMSEDNLDEVASILTTETSQSIGELRWAPTSWERSWTPVIGLNFTRIHQEGQNLPTDGGFSASHIPDQVSTDRGISFEIQGASYQVGYRFSNTEQDNRQPGREFDDFETEVHSIFGSMPLGTRLDATLELSKEQFESIGQDTVDDTERVALGLQYRPMDRLTFGLDASTTRLEGAPTQTKNEDRRLDLVATWRFIESVWSDRSAGGAVFLRYTWEDSELDEPIFALRDMRSDRRLAAGLSFSWQ